MYPFLLILVYKNFRYEGAKEKASLGTAGGTKVTSQSHHSNAPESPHRTWGWRKWGGRCGHNLSKRRHHDWSLHRGKPQLWGWRLTYLMSKSLSLHFFSLSILLLLYLHLVRTVILKTNCLINYEGTIATMFARGTITCYFGLYNH